MQNHLIMKFQSLFCILDYQVSHQSLHTLTKKQVPPPLHTNCVHNIFAKWMSPHPNMSNGGTSGEFEFRKNYQPVTHNIHANNYCIIQYQNYFWYGTFGVNFSNSFGGGGRKKCLSKHILLLIQVGHLIINRNGKFNFSIKYSGIKRDNLCFRILF